MEAIVLTRRELAVSGDICVCHAWGARLAWNGWKPGDASQHSPTPENNPAPMSTGPRVEKPCPRMGSLSSLPHETQDDNISAFDAKLEGSLIVQMALTLEQEN